MKALDVLDVVVILLAGVGGGTVAWWLCRLVRWCWDRRPHGLAGKHDWLEWRTIDGTLRLRCCFGCGRQERLS